MFKPGQPIPRILDVEGLPPDRVRVDWDDGGMNEINLAGWIAANDLHRTLGDASRWGDIRVINYGTALQWGDDDDCVIDNLHLRMLADEQQDLTPADLVRWQEAMQVSNQEAADLIGVRVSTWHNYKCGQTRIPKGTQIGLRAVLKDPLVFEAHYRPRRPGRPVRAAGNGAA